MATILPGQRVRITQNAYDWDSSHVYLIANKGSIAVAISFREYETYFMVLMERREKLGHIVDVDNFDDSPKKVRVWMDEGSQFPFRMIKLAPVPPDENGEYCKVGSIVVLNDKFFELV